MICKHYRVAGRVQGVFFRATTRERAQTLGLTGWVRNDSDGSVELVACGDAANLDELKKWLQQGPAHAKVTTVSESVPDDVDADSFTSFDIVP